MSDKREWIDQKETAKLIRKALKLKFPGHKFSVRMSKGSVSIRIRWMDGPTIKEVDRIVQPFSGESFDGMIDMRYGLNSWLLPDGTAEFAYTNGTEGSAGSVPAASNAKPHPKARLVHFVTSFIFTSRATSAETARSIFAELASKYGLEDPPEVSVSDYDGNAKFVNDGRFVFGDSTWSDLLYREFSDTDLYAKPGVTPPAANGAGYTVEYDRDWTWIKFSEKPRDSAITWLKSLGARFGKRRRAWYIQERVEMSKFERALGGGGQ